MLKLTRLPLAAVVLLVMMTGCKKTAAFLIVDSQTNQPIASAILDHNKVYDFTDPRGGQQYHYATESADENGWIELYKPQSADTYLIRMPGYQTREVRMTQPGKMAEYSVVGGPNIQEWVEAQRSDDDDHDAPTFIIPIDPN